MQEIRVLKLWTNNLVTCGLAWRERKYLKALDSFSGPIRH